MREEQADGAVTENEDAAVPAEPADMPVESVGRRLNRAFGPVVAGLIIDAVDLATFGPIGYVLGLPVGGLAGYWLGRCMGLGRAGSLWCALAAGLYCMLPLTHLLPLATLVGAYVRYLKSAPRETADEE